MVDEKLTDINKIPVHMQGDYVIRNENILHKRKLCDRCDGTGNQLLSMFQTCEKCDGKGYLL